ncbi:regulator of chromosome condensation 1/beta-lactamase-inhibitor protein II [Chytridium lagenaria]|nr:regulator of chromosome condensation 1/beta-lactamase-inhibitor protein II [Chytridium lagenaria]
MTRCVVLFRGFFPALMSNTFVKVMEGTDIAGICACWSFLLAWTSNGIVHRFGAPQDEGSNRPNQISSEAAIRLNTAAPIAKMACMDASPQHVIVLRENGDLEECELILMGGPNIYSLQKSRIILDKNCIDFSCAKMTSLQARASKFPMICAITRHGRIYCWDGDVILSAQRSHDILHPSMEILPGPFNGSSNLPHQISMGSSHVLVKMLDGTVLSWGDGLQGQLGHGSMESYSTESPQKARIIEGLYGLSVGMVDSGAQHSAFVTDAGAFIYTCGSDTFGQLGASADLNESEQIKRNQAIPEPVSVDPGASDRPDVTDKNTKIKFLSCGDRHTVVSDGRRLFGWGDIKWSAVDHMGSKDTDLRKSTEIPLPTILNHSIVSVSCGGWSTVVLLKVDD